MKFEDFVVEDIAGKKICLKGVGKMFYQDGFPIGMAITTLKEGGVEVSILHVADECLKHGWSAKTTYNKIVAEIEDDIDKAQIDKEQLKTFCEAGYEEQREMIHEYLFGGLSLETRKEWAKNRLCENTPR